MTPEEARELPLGLYRLFWTSGGYSLAAVGQTRSGERWYAPANWLSPQDLPSPAGRDWSVVTRVECVMPNRERRDPSRSARSLLERLGLCPDPELVEQILAALRRNNMLDEDADPQKHVRRTFDDAMQCAQDILGSDAARGFKSRAVNLLEAAVSLGELLGDAEAIRKAQTCLETARESQAQRFGNVCARCMRPTQALMENGDWYCGNCDMSWPQDGSVIETARQGLLGRQLLLGRTRRGPAGRPTWIETAEQLQRLGRSLRDNGEQVRRGDDDER